MKIIMLSSLAWSLVNFRGALLSTLVELGHQVIACAPEEDEAVAHVLAAKGVQYRHIAMERASISPFADIGTIKRMVALFRSERPDIVLAYTQKPIIYGGIAARLVGGLRFHAMVSGLGHAYSEGGGARRALLRRIVTRLYRTAVRTADSIIVFNRDDGPEMARHGIVTACHRIVQVPGSGVEMARFPVQPVPAGGPVFLLVARLLRDKGLDDYAAAARIVKTQAPHARFLLLGPFDQNPTGVTREELAAWEQDDLVEYLGETRDVAPYLAAATAIVLPSRYREGLPRTLLEAMSVGRAIVTTDMPGCREPVEPGENGFLVPPGDPLALAGALMEFARDPELAIRMGARSRALAEERFTVDKVNAIIVDTLGLRKGAGETPSRAAPVNGKWEFARRGIDISAALVGGIVALPLLLLLALAVWATVGRPILFIQRRSGRDNIPFALIKFRTMRESRDRTGQILEDSARTPRFGRFLRRSRLDELPSLWNILTGDMTLIGPRPLLPETIVDLGVDGARRGVVRPGLTGWAQVNGNTLLKDRDKLALDLWYIAHRSLLLDLRILAGTMGMVVFGERLDRRQVGRAYASGADRRG